MGFSIRVYLTCAEVFQALGEQGLARAAAKAGWLELQERAGKISNLEWRTSFLENVPEHRKMKDLERQFKE